MNTKTTYIEDIQEVESGVHTKDGIDKPWTLYQITDMDGWRYKTFDVFFLGPAYDNRTEVELTYTETQQEKINPKTDKPYMNRTITSVKVAQSVSAELEKRVARLEAALVNAGIITTL